MRSGPWGRGSAPAPGRPAAGLSHGHSRAGCAERQPPQPRPRRTSPRARPPPGWALCPRLLVSESPDACRGPGSLPDARSPPAQPPRPPPGPLPHGPRYLEKALGVGPLSIGHRLGGARDAPLLGPSGVGRSRAQVLGPRKWDHSLSDPRDRGAVTSLQDGANSCRCGRLHGGGHGEGEGGLAAGQSRPARPQGRTGRPSLGPASTTPSPGGHPAAPTLGPCRRGPPAISHDVRCPSPHPAKAAPGPGPGRGRSGRHAGASRPRASSL